MILLKSELKAKGCFPTALNFLLECQMLCAEIARSRRQGALPQDQPPARLSELQLSDHMHVQVCSHGEIQHQPTQPQKQVAIDSRYKPAEGGKCSTDSKQGLSFPFNIWDLIFLSPTLICKCREGNTEDKRVLKVNLPLA